MTSSATMPPQGRRRGKDEQAIIIVVSVVIVIALVTAALMFGLIPVKPFERNGTFHHNYYVKVEANTTEEYTIRLPVPSDTSGKIPSNFVFDLDVLMGNPAFALGDYGYGMGLEVRATGYLEFEWNKVWLESGNERYGNLTMTTGAEGWDRIGPCYSWVFSDRPDIRVFFHYSSINHYMSTPTFASGGGPTFFFSEYPDGTGWNRVLVDSGWMVIN